MANRPLILITNDDGVHAPGIKALAEAVADFGDTLIVAPHVEQSATSQSITIKVPLRCERIGERVYGIEGTPADCVLFATNRILDRAPDFVLSGINRGANLGTDTLYSGTVGAALEGALKGIKSLAISCCGQHSGSMHYEAAGHLARYILENEERFFLDRTSLLNVNVPNLPLSEIRGIRPAILGRRIYDPSFVEGTDPRGGKYYWTGGGTDRYDDIAGSDCELVEMRFATVTALRASLFDEGTHQRLVENLAGPLPPISHHGTI
jgi:5'-nucleotidase